jgi:hypothetical protein
MSAERDTLKRPELERFLPPLPGRGDGDGYDWMDAVAATPWAVIPSWGREGWDAGQWPYVIIMTAVAVVPEVARPPRVPEQCVHCRRMLHQEGVAWAAEAFGVECPASENAHRPMRQTRVYGVASYVEGDRYRAAYATHEDRVTALDTLVAFYWRLAESPAEVPAIGPVPAEFCGPFSWERVGMESSQ